MYFFTFGKYEEIKKENKSKRDQVVANFIKQQDKDLQYKILAPSHYSFPDHFVEIPIRVDEAVSYLTLVGANTQNDLLRLENIFIKIQKNNQVAKNANLNELSDSQKEKYQAWNFAPSIKWINSYPRYLINVFEFSSEYITTKTEIDENGDVEVRPASIFTHIIASADSRHLNWIEKDDNNTNSWIRVTQSKKIKI